MDSRGDLLYEGGSSNPALRDHLEGRDGVGGGREVQEGGAIPLPVWQEPTHYCKTIIAQLKMNTCI